jgi:hypothetical protein
MSDQYEVKPIGTMAFSASDNHLSVGIDDGLIEVEINDDTADIADPPCILAMQPSEAREFAAMLIKAAEEETR